jgi:hypothetical protein
MFAHSTYPHDFLKSQKVTALLDLLAADNKRANT